MYDKTVTAVGVTAVGLVKDRPGVIGVGCANFIICLDPLDEQGTLNIREHDALAFGPVRARRKKFGNGCHRGLMLGHLSCSSNPRHRGVEIRRAHRGELKTDRVTGCPGLKTPVQVVFYQARVSATGSDHLVYEVMNQTGEVGTYDVTIIIEEAPT